MSPDETSNELVDYINQLSRLSTVAALQLSLELIETSDFRRLLKFLAHLQTLSLEDICLDKPTAVALLGVDSLVGAGGSASSTIPTLHTIWLVRSEIEQEEALRLLVSVRPLRRLRLDCCLLAWLETGEILRTPDLYNSLLDSVPGLNICE